MSTPTKHFAPPPLSVINVWTLSHVKHNNVLVGVPLETIGCHDVYGSVCGCLLWEAGERGGGQKVRRVESEEGKGRGERMEERIRGWERLWRELEGVWQEPLQLGCIAS